MLNVEQYKRYLALQTRLHGNSMLNVEEYSEYIKLHTQFQDSIVAQPTVSNELINQLDVENSNVESNVEAEIIVEKNVDNVDNTIISAESIITAESNDSDIIHYKSYSETNEKNKRQTKYNLTNTPIDLIISKTAMLFITNFKSTNEVKQASKAVGSTAVELMDDMGRSINQCVDDLQVSIGIKRGLSDNSDFDSSDEENESPTKKQRVESPAPN